MRSTQEPAYNNYVLARLLISIEKMGYTHRGFGVMIADAIHCSRKDVSCILSGQKRLTYHFLHSYCAAFGISETWLIEGEGDIFVNKPVSPTPAGIDLDAADNNESTVPPSVGPRISETEKVAAPGR